MATVFPARLPSSWLGKAQITLHDHLLKIILVGISTALLGGSFGMIVLAAAIQYGDLRILIMVLPHALASVLVFSLLLAGIFSLGVHDP